MKRIALITLFLLSITPFTAAAQTVCPQNGNCNIASPSGQISLGTSSDKDVKLYRNGTAQITLGSSGPTLVSPSLTSPTITTPTIAGDMSQSASAGGSWIMSLAGTAGKGLILGASSVPADVSTIDAANIYNFGPSSFFANGAASAVGSSLFFLKSRKTDGTADTIVQNGDQLGVINFYGANGTTFDRAARIIATVDGTPGASADMPAALDFQVAPDGSATAVSALKLSNNKTATFGGTLSVAGQAGAKLIGGTDGFNVRNNTDASGLISWDNSGNITIAGTVKSTATSLGWQKRSAADTACTTTCTASHGCAFGQDTDAATKPLVDCSDATADVCICSF